MPKVYVTIYALDDPRNPVDVEKGSLPNLRHQRLIRTDDSGKERIEWPEGEGPDGGESPAPAAPKPDGGAPAAAAKTDVPAVRVGAQKTASKE